MLEKAKSNQTKSGSRIEIEPNQKRNDDDGWLKIQESEQPQQ